MRDCDENRILTPIRHRTYPDDRQERLHYRQERLQGFGLPHEILEYAS
jgi:hypothetical protein